MSTNYTSSKQSSPRYENSRNNKSFESDLARLDEKNNSLIQKHNDDIAHVKEILRTEYQGKIDSLQKEINDLKSVKEKHESRLTVLEKLWWKASGAAGAVGGIIILVVNKFL